MKVPIELEDIEEHHSQVMGVSIVNNCDECGVKLASECNEKLTSQEEERQLTLHNIATLWKEVPQPHKYVVRICLIIMCPGKEEVLTCLSWGINISYIVTGDYFSNFLVLFLNTL